MRLLALISVALALMCAALAAAWTREHRRAECYHSAAEDDRVPQARECGP